MNEDKILKEINKTKEHLADLENMLIKCKYERWKPKDGEKFYAIDSGLRTYATENNGYPCDINTIKTYGCFQTCDQAEQEAEKILIRRMLEDIARRLNKGRKINWGYDEQPKYLIELYGDVIVTDLFYSYKAQGTVYCLDENFKNVAIQEIGEERLKKYLRGE